MPTNKSILESTELSTGTELTVQAGNTRRVSLSIDGSESNFTIWLSLEELIAFRDTINKTLEEVSQL